jgi:hypothetical protein
MASCTSLFLLVVTATLKGCVLGADATNMGIVHIADTENHTTVTMARQMDMDIRIIAYGITFTIPFSIAISIYSAMLCCMGCKCGKCRYAKLLDKYNEFDTARSTKENTVVHIAANCHHIMTPENKIKKCITSKPICLDCRRALAKSHKSQ